MNIGVDYDKTITLDPVIFGKLCTLFMENGDNIYIVSSRFPNELTDDIRKFSAQYCPYLICTERKAKDPYMKSLGIKIDVWIDDNPAGIYRDVL